MGILGINRVRVRVKTTKQDMSILVGFIIGGDSRSAINGSNEVEHYTLSSDHALQYRC